MAVSSADVPVIVDLTEGRELVINGIATGGYFGSQHVICLATTRAGVSPDGTLRSESAIVARLRFDSDMAKQLRDALDQALAALTPPADQTRAN